MALPPPTIPAYVTVLGYPALFALFKNYCNCALLDLFAAPSGRALSAILQPQEKTKGNYEKTMTMTHTMSKL